MLLQSCCHPSAIVPPRPSLWHAAAAATPSPRVGSYQQDDLTSYYLAAGW